MFKRAHIFQSERAHIPDHTRITIRRLPGQNPVNLWSYLLLLFPPLLPQVVLRIEPRHSQMLGKHSAPKLQPQLSFLFAF